MRASGQDDTLAEGASDTDDAGGARDTGIASAAGLLHYAVAIVAVGATVALRMALPLSGRNVFFMFYPAVAGAAWFGGRWPGLFAAALAAVACNYFLLSPEPAFSTEPVQLIETALFFVLSGAIAWLIGSARFSRSRAVVAAREAHERGERFRVTLAGIGDAVIATDVDARVSFMNAVAEQLTGWAVADARGKPIDQVFKIVNERTRAPVENPVGRVLKEGTTVALSNHTALIAKDGAERLVEDSAAPVRDAAQRTIGAVLIFRDVTERRRAADQRSAVDAQLRLALEAGRMGAWSWDARSDRVTWSDTLAALHGLAPGTFDGTFDSLVALVHPDDRATFRATLDRSLADATSSRADAEYDAEFRILRSDGSVRWMRSTGRVAVGPDGRPARVVGLRYDITEQKAAEVRGQLLADATQAFAAAPPDVPAVSDAVERHVARVREEAPEDQALLAEVRRRANTALENARLLAAERQARAEAQEALAARDRFISIASHELRTPVTTIKGHAQMVLRAHTRGRLEDSRLREALENVNAAADRLNSLVQDLLDVSRLRTGRLTLQLEKVEVASLVRSVLNRHSAHLAEGRRFSTKIASGLPTITADAGRLEQVLVNVIGNAAKYSDRGSTIHVTSYPEDGGVRVEVRDQGIGLPPGAAEQIFEPFSRASNAQQVPGMGLGLYISRNIVQQHGGRMGA
ncbi:MAG TPA: PAS domain-containing protein, partial [Gemmatimonadaceae bacterium]|nr:PAS domain-containing protein [Gemmatimonadaceae bacterium]